MTVQMSVMISTEEIQAKVKELGAQIDAHYANSDKELVLIGLLRGSVIFMADLCRTISKMNPWFRATVAVRYLHVM
jgi:hypoxanthine phosphoribosyltransferase